MDDGFLVHIRSFIVLTFRISLIPLFFKVLCVLKFL